jgi:alanine racemase
MVERTEFIDFSPIDLRPGDRFGVIPFGLRDGISALTCGEVLVRGKRVPIAGSFCMEHTRIDLSLIPDASVGDEVVLIGRQGSEAITLREVTDSQKAPVIMPALSVGSGVQRVLR